MGNCWKGYSDEKLWQAELDSFLMAGVHHSSIKQEDIHLSENDPEDYLHIVRITSDPKLPIMVLLHGYGGGSAVFLRLASGLQSKFNLILVDLLGMGASGRPTYNCKTAEDAIRFFTASLDQLVCKLGLERFILLGHSFGGLISCEYALSHRHKV